MKNVLRKLFISHKFDWILGTALLLVALCLFLVFKNIKKTGSVIQVKQSNKVVDTFDLSEDGEYEYSLLGGTNTLMIKDGYAYVTDSNCSDHICENMGKISKVGETIICLPNELFIKVIEGEEGDFDAISE